MRKKLLTGLLVVILLLAAVLPGVALAANPEVTITVTAQIVAITNTQATWTVSTPIAVDAIVYFSADDTQNDDYSQIENTGNAAVDVEIQTALIKRFFILSGDLADLARQGIDSFKDSVKGLFPFCHEVIEIGHHLVAH